MDRNGRGIKFAAGVAGVCFLVWSGHPWWAGFVLVFTLFVSE